MSFRAKLAIAFSSLLFLIIVLALTNWWGVDRVLSKQDQLFSFTTRLERQFNQMVHDEQLFRRMETLEQSRVVRDTIGSIRAQLEARYGTVPAGEQQAAITSLLAALTNYKEHFTEFNRSLVAMEAMKSRMLKESERLFAYTENLVEAGKRGGARLDPEDVPVSDSSIAKRLQFTIGSLLLAEKDYFLSYSGEAVERVQGLATTIIAQAGVMENRASNNTEKLQAFRISRATGVYLDIFLRFVDEQEKASEAARLVPVSLGEFSSALSRFLDLSRRQTEEQLSFLRLVSAIISVVAVLVGIAAVITLSNLISRPVNALRMSAQQIVDGNLDTSVSVSGDDDLGKLGHLFNEMTARLRGSFRHIENYRDHLEELVDRRTANLEREIAEHRDTEEALRASSERLMNIVSQSPLGIVIFDRDFVIREWNHSCEKIFGFNRDEAIGAPARMILPDSAKAEVEAVFSTLLESRRSTRNQNDNITKSGRIITCNWYNTPLTNVADETVGMLCLVDDITDKLRLEQEALKVKKLESTGVLAGGIAHDFNNILTAILGNISLSLLDVKVPQKTRLLLSAAKKATIRAQALTQQLLTFAKGGEPVKEQTSLKELIKDSAEFVLHGSTTTCRYHFAEGLWMVRADRGQLSQVIQNLVINASQAMPGGGIIDLSCENVADPSAADPALDPLRSYVKISISDTGVGIPATVVEKIFDPYFSTKREGSGLGLAITLSIINKHDGHVTVTSIPGVGSVFTLFLPADTSPAACSEKSRFLAGETQPARILLMDDDEMILNVTTSMLEALGHQVECARDGDECLARFRQAIANGSPPDLIILDLTIPGGKGGEETLREIRGIDPSVKVVVSSGYSNDPVIACYDRYGFSAALSKPYVVEELARVIGKTLGTAS
ncbi:MAG: PAS domain S-box protein [Desulfobulbaceae bacterium]|nr:PAS domain S-box protein [Desulfobulbaceae bacterium]